MAVALDGGLYARVSLRNLVGIKFAAEAAMGRQQPIQVTIVAASAETLRGLQTYLSLAGVGARGTRQLGDVDPEPCSAIVLFPDEFSLDEVLEELSRLRRDRPGILPLLVTREPERYGEVARAEEKGRAPVVIPKPAWGWTILDAIRSGTQLRHD